MGSGSGYRKGAGWSFRGAKDVLDAAEADWKIAQREKEKISPQ